MPEIYNRPNYCGHNTVHLMTLLTQKLIVKTLATAIPL